MIRAAIVGAGAMAAWHARAARRAGAKVVAVVDPDRAAAAALARGPARGAEPFATLGAAAAAGGLDAAHVCTPPAEHLEGVEEALAAGLHALVEKPLAPTAAATERLLRRAEERGRLLTPVHQFLFQEGVRAARRRLPEIAPLTHVRLLVYSAGGDGLPPDARDRLIDDILPHPLSLLDAFGLDLDGAVSTALRPRAGELHVLADPGGVAVSIGLSLASRPTVARCDLAGQGGEIHVDLFHGFACRESGGVSRSRKAARPLLRSARIGLAAAANLAARTLRWEPAFPGLRRLTAAFYAAALSGGPSPIAADATLRVARWRDEILRRAERIHADAG